MPNKENIVKHEFVKGQSGNPKGRPLGARNRSTVAREILSLEIKGVPESAKKNIIKVFPNLPDTLTIEEIMTMVMATRAIIVGDASAYRALEDSAYGQPKQDIHQSFEQRPVIQIVDLHEKENND